MEAFVEEHFGSSKEEDKKLIIDTLANVGVDTEEDFKLLTEEDLAGKLKPIHIRKLLKICNQQNSPPIESKTETVPDVQVIKEAAAPPPLDTPIENKAESDADKTFTTENLALASGVLSGAVFAALVPHISIPLIIASSLSGGAFAAVTTRSGLLKAFLDSGSEEKNSEIGVEGEEQVGENVVEVPEENNEPAVPDDSVKNIL